MRAILKAAVLTLLAGALLALGWIPAFPQTANRQYFPETGHFVEGEFLEFYKAAPAPELVYGYPITEAFIDPTTGILVQYFQRARFELHPEAAAAARVQLTPLGAFLHTPAASFPLASSPSVCRSFPETGFQVCLSFLQFFDKNGGLAQFGPPISDVELRDNRLVQYFERARFEWHPDAYASRQEVQLTELGLLYFYEVNEDPSRLRSVLAPDIQDITSLTVRIFPVQAVVALQGQQGIYVIVQDQTLNPVAGAQVRVTVKLPSGQKESFLFDPTNQNGITSAILPFTAGPDDLGFVVVEAEVTYENALREKAVTSFRLTR